MLYTGAWRSLITFVILAALALMAHQPAAQPATQPVELTIVAWPFEANESLGVDELRVAVEAAMERSGALAVVADRAAGSADTGR